LLIPSPQASGTYALQPTALPQIPGPDEVPPVPGVPPRPLEVSAKGPSGGPPRPPVPVTALVSVGSASERPPPLPPLLVAPPVPVGAASGGPPPLPPFVVAPPVPRFVVEPPVPVGSAPPATPRDGVALSVFTLASAVAPPVAPASCARLDSGLCASHEQTPEASTATRASTKPG
jgi:hypothetical protein